MQVLALGTRERLCKHASFQAPRVICQCEPLRDAKPRGPSNEKESLNVERLSACVSSRERHAWLPAAALTNTDVSDFQRECCAAECCRRSASEDSCAAKWLPVTVEYC